MRQPFAAILAVAILAVAILAAATLAAARAGTPSTGPTTSDIPLAAPIVTATDPAANAAGDPAPHTTRETVADRAESVARAGPADGDDHGASVAQPTVGARPDVEVIGASAAERVVVDEALGRFRRAGLRLPDVEIVFHDDRADCRGHDGLFQTRHTPWRVLVCSDLEFVLTHELAHAWEAANLDDADRDRYVEHRGLSTWDDPDAAWGERGVEDAAFMLQQNLMAGRVDVTSERWVERTSAYEALTGTRSPVVASA